MLHTEDKPIISKNAQLLFGKLNKEAFQFKHNLAGNALFELPRLAQMADTVLNSGRSGSYVLSKVAESVPNISKQWVNFTSSERVAESIRHIREAGTWIMIAGAQVDPDYNDLLQQILREIEDLSGAPIAEEMTWVDATVFIASPNSVTHYHIDTEANFLFQIHGAKEAHLFDPSDRSVLSEEALESYYMDRKNAPAFKDHYEATAHVFDFTPGNGLHIPVNAPHWVKNLEDYVVTFSVLFYLKSMDRRAWVYQANHVIRRLGLRPTPPGRSESRDFWKSRLIEAFSKRSPRSKDELLRSGIRRLGRPFRAHRKIARLLGAERYRA